MKTRSILIGFAMMLAGCSASHQRPADAAIATPQSGASMPARAAGAEPRKVIIPKVRDVHAGRVASPTVTPSAAAKAAGAGPRNPIIPKVRVVPTSGVTSPAPLAPTKSVTKAGGPLPYGVPYASEKDPVTIVSFAISSKIFHPGDNVSGDVVTSSNAASVTARVGSFAVTVPKVAPGKFHFEMQLPSMPLPAGDQTLIITAMRTDGKSTTREIAITVAL
jgi:hypothetical protein